MAKDYDPESGWWIMPVLIIVAIALLFIAAASN